MLIELQLPVGGQPGACGGGHLGQEHLHGLRGENLDSQF